MTTTRISFTRISKRGAKLGITEVSRTAVGKFTLVEWSTGHVSKFITEATTGL